MQWIRLADETEVHTSVVDGRTLATIRSMVDKTRYRLSIEPAPNWEEVDRWLDLETRLTTRSPR